MPPPSRPDGNAGQRDDPDRPESSRDGARRNRHQSQNNADPPPPPRNPAGNNPPGPPSPPDSDHEGSRHSHGSRRARGRNGERRNRIRLRRTEAVSVQGIDFSRQTMLAIVLNQT